MAKNPTLIAEKRTTLGKAVKKLRRDGKLPANVYGKGLDSQSIQVDTKTFEGIFKEVGETGLIDLQFEGTSHPVLVKNIQLKYPLKTPLHVDFYQVNLKEKVKTMVPLEIIGEPKAVTDNIGILIQQLNEVEVEALPTDLPEKIEVNVERLTAIDEHISVSQLTVPGDVEILNDPEQIIVKIEEPVVEEPEPEETEATEGEGETEEGEKSEAGENKEESNNGDDAKDESESEKKD